MKKVFGLDIGTRSIVGTVGYRDGGKFHVLAQRSLEHETRAMLDGQIHDIAAVGEGVIKVKELLEQDLGEELTEVCIAAAGRVLRTVTTNVEMRFDGDKDVNADDVYELSMMGVQKAYEEFHTGVQTAVRFYCVGYTVMRYYINGYQMNNPEGHKARTMAADMIATFLPDDVVDGLYKAVEMAQLRVANLTLEPIAAIQVAIPERYRLLNMALVDVGAGTSDICITKEGTITAYGMIPVAGDSLTDCIAQNCLVDFDTAERIKRAIGTGESVAFEDIMGLPQVRTQEELQEMIRPAVWEMTRLVAERILELNGGKTVSAVFVVGGGGIIPGYTQFLAEQLELPIERVAIRGQEVMQNIIFDLENARKDSMMVTPIGICYSYYEQSNNFIFVEFNGVRIKLYDNGKLTVADAAIQSQFPNENLFPRRGDSLTYTVNDRAGMTRGGLGEPAVITVNGRSGDLNTRLTNGDRVDVIASTKGDAAVQELGKLPEMKGNLKIRVNGEDIALPKLADVNGISQSVYYRVKNGDAISVRSWYTVQEIAVYLGLTLNGTILVNDAPSKTDTKVYDSFTVSFGDYNAQQEAEKARALERKRQEKEKAALDAILEEEAAREEKEYIEKMRREREQRAKERKMGIHNSSSVRPRTEQQNKQQDMLRQQIPFMMNVDHSKSMSVPFTDLNSLNAMIQKMNAADQQAPSAGAGNAGIAGRNSGTADMGFSAGLGNVGSGNADRTTMAAASRRMPSVTAAKTVAEAPAEEPAAANVSPESAAPALKTEVNVIANRQNITLKGKSSYVYVDIFDYIHFDLTRPAGKAIVTKLNGRRAEYMEQLHNGDVIEIYWE